MKSKSITLKSLLYSIKSLQNIRWNRALKRFMNEQLTRGITLRAPEVTELLIGAQAVLIDAPLVMEGWNAVRMAAAPLSLRAIDQFKKQGSWMMLTAGVALGCDGYGPLEDFATEMNFQSSRMAKQYPKIDHIPYDDERQIETTIHRDANGLRAFAKGAPEAILDRCTHVLDGPEREMDELDRGSALLSAQKMEACGLETLAFSTKWMETAGDFEREMVFLGIVGMGDLPTEETPVNMEAFRAKGIRPVLISETPIAESAIRASNVLRPNAGIMLGSDMDAMDDATLKKAAPFIDAFIGLHQAQRSRVMRALRAEGIVAYLAELPGGGVSISTRRGEAMDVSMTHADLDDVVAFFEECFALYDAYRDG